MPARQFTFPKSRRLTLSAEFEHLKKNGRAQRGGLIVLSVVSTNDSTRFRAGFITPKHIGTAVTRNRVRRRLRDIVRREQPRLQTGVWIVVVARPYAANATHQQLKDEWLRLAERASILAP